MPIALAAGALAAAAAAAAVRGPKAPPAAPPALAAAPSALAAAPPALAAAPLAVAGAPAVDGAHTTGRVVVYVAGAVRRPGVYALGAGSRVDAAVRAASGVTGDADMLAVNLAEPLQDGEKVLVPPRGVTSDWASAQPDPGQQPRSRARHGRRHRTTSASGAGRAAHRRRGHKEPPSTPIDVNAADAAALEQLPGVGAGMAERIISFRDANGPFRTTDELLDVAGMTDRRFEAIVPYVVAR
jgi:competence protein ComEA